MFVSLIKKLLSNLKVTQICVTFFILLSFSAQALPLKMSFESKKIGELKKKITELIIQKNRGEAVKLLSAAEATALASEDTKLQLLSIKENILSVFLNQESQDLFESSAAQFIQKINLAEKNILSCLDLEPDNLYCRWQQLKILNYKNDPTFKPTADHFISDVENFSEFGLLALTLNTNVILKNEKQILFQKNYPVLFYIIEFERSMSVQNYSLSKEALQKITTLAPDYPDLMFMRAKLMELSQEDILTEQSSAALYHLYKKTCSSLRPELTRKYFYDINLCHRSF